MKTLDTINSLYLELSHVATATTAKEIETQKKIQDPRDKAIELCHQIEKCGASEELTRASMKASEIFCILQGFNVADTQ